MASKYSSVVYIQGNSRRRYRAYVSATVSNTSATKSRVSWTARVEMYNAYLYGVAVSCTVGGTKRAEDEGYLSSNPGSSYKTVASVSGTTDYDRGSKAKSVTVTARAWGETVSGHGSAGGSASASVTVKIPAIDYSEPAAPSGLSASYASDSRADLSWENGATGTTTPRSAVLVERQADSGSWVQVAKLGASAENYADTGLSANHRYRWRARSQGAGGYSEYATSGYVYTTPAAPSSVTASKTGASGVSLDIGGGAPWAEEWEVQRSADGGSSWGAAGTATSWPWADPAAPAGTVRYRVRAVRGSLASAWRESNEVTTICPPLAPSVTLSPPAAVLPTGTALTVLWVPSHPDGSAQTAAQVAWDAGSGETTEDVTGEAAYLALPDAATATACTLLVRVRTRGLDEGWGAWSAPIAVRVAVPPRVEVTSPAADAAVVDALPLALSWSAEDATGVAAQSVEVLDATGATLLSVRPGASARSLSVGAADLPWENGASYLVRVTVSGGSSLTAAAERSFRTEWAEPAAPAADVGYDRESLSCSVTVWAGEGGGSEPPTSGLSVARVLADGSRFVLGEGLLPGTQVLDRLPPLNAPFSYEVTAVAESGAASAAVVPALLESNASALNFGADAGVCEQLLLNPSWSRDVSRTVELMDFADGGESGGLPVGYATGASSGRVSHSAVVLGREAYARLLAIARERPFGWYRDVYGNRSYCAVSLSFSGGVGRDTVSVSVDMQETAWREASLG